MPRKSASNDGTAALTVGLLGANLFGPQSPWSSLLGQREHLHHEIKRGRKYLEQLRKDLAECGALLQAWPDCDNDFENGWMPSPIQQAAANDATERFLLDWLARLEERLVAVTKEIEDFESHGGLEPIKPEESMFELLRAAG
jgi:hypothetical protein